MCSCRSLSELSFGAVEQPSDVPPMSEDDQGRDGQADRGDAHRPAGGENDQGEGQGAQDRAEGYVARQPDDDQEQARAGQTGGPGDGREGAERSGDAFPAPEADREREAVSDHGQQPAERGERRVAEPAQGEKCRQEALQDIEHSDRQGDLPALDPQDIGRARASASVFADVPGPGPTGEKIAGRNGAEEIRRDGDDDLHGSAASKTIRYSAPSGRRRLSKRAILRTVMDPKDSSRCLASSLIALAIR